MTTIPLGVGAYKRTYAQFPEIQLLNRFVEKSPANPREHASLLTRPGTKFLEYFPPDIVTSQIRGSYSSPGVFNSDLFVVSGKNLYRYDGVNRIPIEGEILGSGNPRVGFVKGIGYEHMFIADSMLLQFYDGGTHATNVMAVAGSPSYVGVKIQIGSTFYAWDADVNNNAPDGSAAHPFLCLPGMDVASTLENMANMISFIGVPGTDFSSSLAGANTQVTCLPTSTTIDFTSRDGTPAANDIVTVVTGSADVAFATPTMTGGGTHALHGVAIPTGEGVSLVAVLNLFVWVGVNNSQKFFYIRPGEITIDALDFASKESAPDPLSDLVAVGDVMVVIGTASTEFWSATGDNDNPFAPITGRTMSRGAVAGTAVAVDERTIMLVGNDGRVYSVAATPDVVSDHGIEERIRIQLRREAGIT